MVEEVAQENLSKLWLESIAESFINAANNLTVYILDILPSYCQGLCETILVSLISVWDSAYGGLDSSFSDFQIKLLQLFFGIFTIHIIAICIAWKVYNQRITDRFLRPSQQITTEQLRSALSDLKLPAEHTPRW